MKLWAQGSGLHTTIHLGGVSLLIGKGTKTNPSKMLMGPVSNSSLEGNAATLSCNMEFKIITYLFHANESFLKYNYDTVQGICNYTNPKYRCVTNDTGIKTHK